MSVRCLKFIPASVIAAGLSLAALCTSASAQGVPASVSSYNFGGVSGPRGIPPSVTSPGFGQQGNRGNRGQFNNGNGHGQSTFVPYYPFGYPTYYVSAYPAVAEPFLGYTPDGTPVDDNSSIIPQSHRATHSDVLALREYEALLRDEIADEEALLHKKRAALRHTEPPAEPAEAQAPAEPVQQTDAPGPQPESVLIFTDGHKAEVSNYAIVGDALFDLSSPAKPHKIAIAELNVPATIKANDERGLDFQLPKLPTQ